MQGFALDALRTLVAAADTGSIARAADIRHLSPSALSEQLRKLESQAGQGLLTRGKSGVRLTPAGERLLVHARQILALSDTAWRDLREVPLAGEVRLGITDYCRPADLTRVLARLGRAFPQVRLRTRVDKSQAIDAAHRAGELDLAITLRVHDSAQGGRVLRSEPLVWAMAGKMAEPARSAPLPLALLPETCSLHHLALSRLKDQGRAHVLAHVASGVLGLQAAIAAGLGVGCVNASLLTPQMRPVPAEAALPALPAVQFVLLPVASPDVAHQARVAPMAEAVIAALAA